MKKINLILLTLFSNFLIGQVEPTVNALSKNAPNSSSTFARPDININSATGGLSITYPITSMLSKGYSLAVALVYDAKGRKIDEYDGEIGWGWNLRAGGMISRSIVGKLDEAGNILQNLPTQIDNLGNRSWGSDWTSNSNPWIDETLPSQFDMNLSGHQDLARLGSFYQPDEFSFFLPNGTSGSFYIDQSGNPVLIPFQNLKIEIGDRYESFIIVDENGFKYAFNIRTISFTQTPDEQNTLGYTLNAPHGGYTAWHLTEIYNPYDELEFKLTYENSNTFVLEKELLNTVSYAGPTCPSAIDKITRYVYTTESKHLTVIENGYGEKIQFIYTNSPSNISHAALDKIVVREADNSINTTFDLNHSYFPTETGQGENRLKLNSVSILNGNSQLIDPTIFEYDDNHNEPFPGIGHGGTDHWGFYNGINTLNIRRVEVNGGRKRSNPFYNQMGILKKITYPSGIQQLFSFETNTYSQSPSGIVDNESISTTHTFDCNILVESVDYFDFIEPQTYQYTNSCCLNPLPVGQQQPLCCLVEIPEPNEGIGYTFYNPTNHLSEFDEGGDHQFEMDDLIDVDRPTNYSYNTDLMGNELCYVPKTKLRSVKKYFVVEYNQHIHLAGLLSQAYSSDLLHKIVITNAKTNSIIFTKLSSSNSNTIVDENVYLEQGFYQVESIVYFPSFENVIVGFEPMVSNFDNDSFIELELTLISRPISPSNLSNFGGGLRLKTVLNTGISSDPEVHSVTKYTYESSANTSVSNGMLLSDPIYEYYIDSYFERSKMTGLNCTGSVNNPCSQCEARFYIESGFNPLIQVYGSYIVYSQVRSELGDDENNFDNGYVEQNYIIEESFNSSPSFGDIQPYRSWRCGLPSSTKVFNEAGELISENNYTYSQTENSLGSIKSLFSGETKFKSIGGLLQTCDNFSNPCENKIIYSGIVQTYTSEIFSRTEEKSKIFDQLNPSKVAEITTIYEYSSDVKGLPSKIIKTYQDPENTYVVTKIKYVGDYVAGSLGDEMCLALNYLLNIGHFSLSTPIEVITLRGSTLNELEVIGGQLSTFRLFENKIVANATYKLELDEPISESNFLYSTISGSNFIYSPYYRKISTNLEYDQDQRIISTMMENDIINTVIRDYPNGRVVAEITNAESDACAYSSFETSNGGGWTYVNNWTTSIPFTHLGFNLKKAKTGSKVFGFQGTSITKQAKPGKYIVSMWSTSPAFSLTVNGVNQSRVIEEDGQDAMGWAYYEYLVDCTINQDIVISGSSGQFLDELRMYPIDASMKTVAYNQDGTVRTVCGINNRCTTYLYDSWKRPEWTLDDNWEILTHNEYHIKNQNDPNDHSWVKQKVVLEAGVNKTNVISATSYSTSIRTTISYTDDLGRPLQNIAVRQSPAHYDMVSFHVYDELGREKIKYAPFTKPANNGSFVDDIIDRQSNFYQSASKVAHTHSPFTESVFEASPIGRAIETGNIGDDWQIGTDHTMKYFQLLNDESDEIIRWEFDRLNGACAINSSNNQTNYYPENSLIKNYIVDEHENSMWEFINASGQVICKRLLVLATKEGPHVYTWPSKADVINYPNGEPLPASMSDWVYFDTYFIYDEFGRLIYELPAIAIQKMDGNYCFVNRRDETNYDIINGYCSVYEYDKRGRKTVVKKPGEDPTLYVYNNLNQVVLSKSPELPSETWNYIKYDVFGRPVQTGHYHTALERVDMQNICDNATTNLWELRSGSNASPYQGNSFPVLSNTDVILTETYYDDYAFDTQYFEYNFWDNNQDVNKLSQGKRIKGGITGTKTRILESTETYPYLLSVNYYDKKGHSNLTFSQHILGGFDRYLSEFDYTGKITQTLRTHKKTLSPADDPIFILNKFTYDHAARPILTMQKADGEDLIILSKLSYNELGQVVKKQLHLNSETNVGMQVIDYRYNERGWLTKINNSDLVNDGDNMESWDVFGEELIYQEQNRYYSDYYTISPQYNGNVAAIKWKTKHQEEDASTLPAHSYVFSYDILGQMLGAYYASTSSTYIDNFSYNQHLWDELLNYDANGNVLSILRHRGKDVDGYDLENPLVVDNLTLEYKKKSNLLINVNESGESGWQTPFHILLTKAPQKTTFTTWKVVLSVMLTKIFNTPTII